MWELLHSNLTSPVVLAFALGVAAACLGSDFRLPPAVGSLLSTYLLFAIGLKGGVALRSCAISELWGPALATLAVGGLTPVVSFGVLRKWGRFSVADAGSLAAHYGSVSAVTFTAAVGFVEATGASPEGFLPAMVALLEVPGIVIALALAHSASEAGRLSDAVREVLTGKSVLLLVGGMAIGAVAGADGTAAVNPLFVDLFRGVLVLFLLDLGTVAGQRLAEIRQHGAFLVGFGIVAPIVFGLSGTIAGTIAGLSPAGAGVLGAMAASASYIAAPAATQVGLPEANPAVSLTPALAITFPFNLAVGIPMFDKFALAVA